MAEKGKLARFLGNSTAALLAALATAIAFVQPARADEDAQGWASATATGAVSGDLFLWLEGQVRLTDDIGGGNQIIVRPAIGARIGRDAHAIAGYAYVRTDPSAGSTTHEHRPWQQLQFVPLRHGDDTPAVISRTRIEQRMVEGRDGTVWRLRQFVRGQVPIAKGGAVQAVAFTEGFVNLNSADWGPRRGVDQWRTFVGIGFPLADRVRLEPGYLNQRVFRRGEDRTNHVLNAALFIRL